MRDFLRKLTSRKFLSALLSAVTGIALALEQEGGAVVHVVGAAVTLLSTAVYILVEGRVDARAAATVQETLARLAAARENEV